MSWCGTSNPYMSVYSDRTLAPLQNPSEPKAREKETKSSIKYPRIWDAQKDEPGLKRTSVTPRKYPRRYVPSSFYCGHEFSELSVMFGSPPNCEPAEDIMPCIGCPCCCDMMDDPAERGPEPLAGLPEAPGAFVDGFFFLGFCRPSRFACSRASLRPQLLSRNTSAYRVNRQLVS